MARPSATSSKIDPRLRPMKRTSSMTPSWQPPRERRAVDDVRLRSGLVELGGLKPLAGAEQVGRRLAIGDIGQRNYRLLVGVDDLALSVREPLRDARRQVGVQVFRF